MLFRNYKPLRSGFGPIKPRSLHWEAWYKTFIQHDLSMIQTWIRRGFVGME
jgi:hypothetical protein